MLHILRIISYENLKKTKKWPNKVTLEVTSSKETKYIKACIFVEFALQCMKKLLQIEFEFEYLIIWFTWMHCLHNLLKFAKGKINFHMYFISSLH